MKEFLPYIVPLLFAALIIRRSGRERKVRLGRMWIRPVILVLMATAALAAGPMPPLLVLAAFVVAAGVGAGLGYLLAQHQHLTIDSDTGHISSRSSTIGTALILVLFAIRFGAKLVFPELADPGHPGHQVTQAADGLLIFTVAVLVTQSVELWRRTRPLLADHAARKLAPAEAPGTVAAAAPPPGQPKAQPTE
jgi:hypothetical protein